MANEILSQLFENQKIQMQRDAALRESLDSKVTNALSRVLNDDAALNEIKENIAYTIEQFDSLAQRVYGYTHEAIVTDNLEKDYQDITTSNPDLVNDSAVGLLAILSDGDTVAAQKNRLFINAVESKDDEDNPKDYSFSGKNSQNGIEFVKIWYFQNDGSYINLSQKFTFDSVFMHIKNKNTITIDSDNLNAQTVKSLGFNGIISTAVIKSIEYENTNTDLIVVPSLTKTFKAI